MFYISAEYTRFVLTKLFSPMMEQYIGDGANTFIIIIACLVGFAAAVGFLDFRRANKENHDN